MTHAPDALNELEALRADRDRYATAYRKLIDLLEQKRLESDRHARDIEEKKVRGKDGQLIPYECAISISGLAGGYRSAIVTAINLFEGPKACATYMQRTIPPVPETAGHPMGTPTLEQQNDWGVYCPHGQQIVERDPDHTDPEGQPVGRLITPWPCTEDGCTLEAFEAAEQERQNDELEAISALASDMHR